MFGKTIGAMFLGSVVAMGSGCATGSAKLGRASEGGETKVVEVGGQRLAMGPVVLHAYPEASTGDVWVVKVKLGDDSDCAQASARRRPLVAGKTTEVAIAADEMACAASRKRAIKIAWHVHKLPAPQVRVVASATVVR